MPWIPLQGGKDADDFVRPFKKQSRFLIDEDVTAELTAYMRDEGYNVTSVIEQGMAGSSDDEVFQFARRERRILITRNGRDFWNDARFPIDQTAGVAILGSEDPRAAIHALNLMGKWGELWEGSKVQFAANGEIVFKGRNLETGAVTTKRFRFTRGKDPEQWVDP